MHLQARWLLSLSLGLVSVLSLAGSASAQFQVDVLAPNVNTNGLGFGSALAIDGETAVVGARGASVGGFSSSGAAFVFRRVAGSWTQEAMIAPLDPQSGSDFGVCVAVSGNRAFVGADSAMSSTSGLRSGAVYVFRRTGTFPFATWSQLAKVEPSDPAQLQAFGSSVAADGSRLLVGCDHAGAQGWAAYVFQPSGGSWSLMQRIDVPADFGRAVALDGDRAAISKAGASGEVRLYAENGGVWQNDATLVPPSQENDDSFGASLDLKSGLLVVGQPRFRVGSGNEMSGRMLVARVQAGAWSPLAPVEWSGQFPDGQVGHDVATNGAEFVSHAFYSIGSIGTEALVVGRWASNDVGPSKLGEVLPQNPTSQTALGGRLGMEGDDVLVARQDNVAVVSLVPPAPVVYCTGKLNSAGCVGSVTSVGSASASSSTPFEINASSIVSGKYGLLFFGVDGRTAFPFQGGHLCALPPTRRTTAQASGGTVGANDCSGSYSFDFNALIRSGAHPDLEPGVLVNAQYWYRDPASASTTGLTNAIEFGIGF
jgi:hypothetical protein